MQALDMAVALLYVVSLFGYDVWVISLTAYLAIILLKDESSRLRNIVVWTILIGAILTTFNVVVTDLYVGMRAYYAHLIDDRFWQMISVHVLYLLAIGAVTSFPVINEARRRKQFSPA